MFHVHLCAMSGDANEVYGDLGVDVVGVCLCCLI